MIGIYKIINPKGKVYIGQSWNIQNRFWHYFALSCKSQIKLYNSFLKYGVDNHKFEIIHELPEIITQEELNGWEIWYWQLEKHYGKQILNLREPGSRGKNNEETKKKISENNKKSMLGKYHTEESKLKMVIWHIGKEITEKQNNSLKEGRKIAHINKKRICEVEDIETNIIMKFESLKEFTGFLKYKHKPSLSKQRLFRKRYKVINA